MAHTRPVKLVLSILCVVFFVLFTSMIDTVHYEGDHVSHLVIAPYPTLGFVYGGGEEGSWQRNHPHESPPWWLCDDYVILLETSGGLMGAAFIGFQSSSPAVGVDGK